MMKLFHECLNQDFTCVLEVLRRMAGKGCLDAAGLREIAEGEGADWAHIRSQMRQAHLLDSEKGPWKAPDWLASFPIPISAVEREYLAHILTLPLAALFFDSEELARLQKLAGTEGRLCARLMEDTAPPEKLSPRHFPDRETFRGLLCAIQQRRRIQYQFRTRDDAAYRTARAVPYRMEYNAYDGRWWLLLYDEENGRSIKSVLANIRGVTLLEQSGISEEIIEDALADMKDGRRLVLRVENQRNAPERCFHLFCHYGRFESARLENGGFQLSLEYFSFDEEDILKNLFYLGRHVTLVEPEDLRRKLTERLRLALENLSE